MAKKNEDSWDNYAYPVYKGIMNRDLIFGIPFLPFLIIGLTTIAAVVFFGFWQILPISFFLFYLMREITKNDSYLLDVFINSLTEPDYLN